MDGIRGSLWWDWENLKKVGVKILSMSLSFEYIFKEMRLIFYVYTPYKFDKQTSLNTKLILDKMKHTFNYLDDKSNFY